MTTSAGGPGQRVPAQVRAAAGDQPDGAGAVTLGAAHDRAGGAASPAPWATRDQARGAAREAPGAAHDQAGGGARTEALGDSEDRIREATEDRSYEAPAGRLNEAVEMAAVVAEETGGLGTPGRPMNRRSPFFIGMAAAAGVAVTFGLVELTIRARSVLVLIGLALFIAAGLDPAVGWLTRHGVRRWAAVLLTLLAVTAAVAAFLAAAIPPLAAQTTALVAELPRYMHSLQDHNSQLGRLDAQYHIQQRLSRLISTRGSSLIGGVLGAGELVLGAASSLLIVAVLSVYFLADMPRIKLFAYRLAPHSRRTRVILIGDEIFAKVGGFVLGNFLTSVIAGLGTYLWMLAFGLPYPILLGIFVAFMDLIPVIGSTIGGAVVTLVALSVSVPIAIATLGFYIAYRLAEDYLLVPRVMGRTVRVPGVVSVVAVLVGGTLMGIVGALVAIPAAAALRLLLEEVAFHRLDDS
jgi:predicted PurR-regulated permease PerM